MRNDYINLNGIQNKKDINFCNQLKKTVQDLLVDENFNLNDENIKRLELLQTQNNFFEFEKSVIDLMRKITNYKIYAKDVIKEKSKCL